MKILLTSSSRHGSTDEIANVIAEHLRAGGLEVDVRRPEVVDDVEGYDAFVLGSAIYMTHWTQEATDFTQRFLTQLSAKPVWAFSVGLSGLPQGKISDPHRIGPVLLSLDVENHVTFAGRFDPTRLNLRERTIARLGGAAEGDYVDVEAVRAWAEAIRAELAPTGA
ncbi:MULTISPECIES: flavodoxin domain-containing protein [unclassified Actinomyces]|uniref:flavodoxin domain-containing protein n=1 Tax=unclassified Actinomyces TaxID=2609248 RepID=UPI002016E604|nr:MULTISPECIES: flavodoxin domain-containing protein [unclassified Actinomyces]MCL3778602.1 flavodoxin domain-containing protein [Actinomyces sp. AC-20-1]MCL3790343.1 flavodoxin domain-containing protein [Actinomyces sp. 187325]MCL3792961.1 flavodoxin domain-containing protein [Actinomyces sp. 186855]MCL3795128.1 flavodoxin domain-containing protein [Actinomyces sp. 217892]